MGNEQQETASMNGEESSSFNEELDESTETGKGLDGSSETGTGNQSESKGKDPTQALAYNETKAVNRSKLLVYAVLLVMATGASIGTYFSVYWGEQHDFEQQFKNDAEELIRGSEDNSKNIFGGAMKISDSLTSFALATNATWPFVTLPNFEIATTPAFAANAGAEIVMFAPKVFRKDRRAYEQYAQIHQGWIQEDLRNRGLEDVDPGKVPEKMYYVSKDDDVETEFSVPLWQIGPAPRNATIILNDLYSQASFRRMIDDLSEVVDHESLSKVLIEKELLLSKETVDQPSSYAALPIFDDYHVEKNIVGFLFAIVPWDIYFRNILSDSAREIIVEVEDTCGSAFSYLVNGPQATFAGHGRLDISSKLRELKHTTDFAEFARFTGAPALENLQFCNYQMTIYPTSQYEEEFTSNEPYLFAAGVGFIFLFTSSVFALYDCMVTRRQRKVMATAERTTAIVNEMFPKQIQDRILRQAQENKSISFATGQKTKLKAFLNNDGTDQEQHDKPIADLFPDVTVMFGDVSTVKRMPFSDKYANLTQITRVRQLVSWNTPMSERCTYDGAHDSQNLYVSLWIA
eukprot:scaffold742_cov165-Amphora_coffeaeformis.AAC.13